jgi:hypothetical protein
MLAILVLSLITIVLAVLIGLLFGADTHGDSDELTQMEYLSQWSDMQRLRKW